MGATFIPNRSLGFMPDEYLFRADWPHRWRSRSGLRRDWDVDKMPNVTQGESRESLLAMPSPSNVMEHKEMLIWHKETLKSEKGYKSRPNDRFGFISVRRLLLRAEFTFYSVRDYANFPQRSDSVAYLSPTFLNVPSGLAVAPFSIISFFDMFPSFFPL